MKRYTPSGSAKTTQNITTVIEHLIDILSKTILHKVQNSPEIAIDQIAIMPTECYPIHFVIKIASL